MFKEIIAYQSQGGSFESWIGEIGVQEGNMIYMDLHVISIVVILEIVIDEVNQGVRK